MVVATLLRNQRLDCRLFAILPVLVAAVVVPVGPARLFAIALLAAAGPGRGARALGAVLARARNSDDRMLANESHAPGVAL